MFISIYFGKYASVAKHPQIDISTNKTFFICSLYFPFCHLEDVGVGNVVVFAAVAIAAVIASFAVLCIYLNTKFCIAHMLPEQFLFEYIILVFWLVVAIKLPKSS